MLLLSNLSFSATSISMYFIALTILVIAIISILRYFFAKQKAKILSQYQQNKNKNKFDFYRVKYSAVNVFSFRSSFLNLGLLLALTIALLSLSWTTYSKDIIIPEDAILIIEDMEQIPPRTADKPIPIPPPLPPIIIALPNDEAIEEQGDLIDQSVEASDEINNELIDTFVAATRIPIIQEEDEEEAPFRIVEEMPRFPGCENNGPKKDKILCANKGLLSYIYSNIKYPSIARENGIEGTAVIRFVVEKDGSVTNIRIARDIGAGCGEEASRVVSLMEKENILWTPGKQRGRAVRVMFTLPIKFRLE